MQQSEISPNFNFLKLSHLAETATLAEKYYQYDPDSSLIKSRQFAELCAKYVAAQVGIYEEIKNEKQIEIIKKLRKKKVIHSRIFFLFNDLRNINLNNEVAHSQPEQATNVDSSLINNVNEITALKYLCKVHQLAVWYHSAFHNPQEVFQPFQIPPNPIGNINKLEQTIETLKNQRQQESVSKIEAELEQAKKEQEEQQKIVEIFKQEFDQQIEYSNLNEALTNISASFINNSDNVQSQIRQAETAEGKTILEQIVIDSDNIPRLSKGLVIRHRYRIVKELGQGSFSTTYIAEDLDRPYYPLCVVKQFQPFQSDKGTFCTARRLFNQEAETLQKLGDHLYIPTLYAFFEENNNLYLVQEYIDGNVLSEEIVIGEPWQEEKVIKLLKQILLPLDYVHQQNIVHRDLKPDNLIQRAEDDHIVLIDFGAVKQILEDSKQQGTVVGTIGYMSAEQYEGNITKSCDVYAVGVIAIEAVTGKKIKDFHQPRQWLQHANHISDQLKSIIINMTMRNYEERYSDAGEVLTALENLENKVTDEKIKATRMANQAEAITNQDNPHNQEIEKSDRILAPPPTTKKPLPFPLLVVIGALAVLLIGGLSKLLPYFLKTKITDTDLTIGILWKPEAYQSLLEYIEDNTVPVNLIDYLKGKKVKVLINGDKTLSYAEAQTRMENKEWDIAFALSPINSIFAKRQGYKYLAGMFPGSSSYQSGFFVRQNSPIQNLNDINTQTIIALGGFNSASSFYIPVYDLYGQTINTNTGNRAQVIIELVKQGKADVGAAAIGDFLKKDDPELRIIHVSREIPGSGVYLSPNLAKSDRENLKQLLLKAPAEVQQQANYGEQLEPNYTDFTKIIDRVQEILICADFGKNPVTLGCPPNAKIQTIEGKVNGVSIDINSSLLKVLANDGKIYHVFVPLDIIKELFSGYKLTDIQGKSIVLKTNHIDTSNNNIIMIKQATQLKILAN